ncbi:hypothetical protein N752_04930 [Desulforamulus aquiferis]|nr:selenium metabolism-associated LysR family transcriptional regulator [Desulforamulus aquiferis]RYD06237.1 hypothetical protein N752_04930 [Desulforamulus aquiferis]
MGLYQFQVFKMVADKKSFSGAAQALFISQPAVSLQIKTLENHFGTRLFHRDKQQVTITETGRILYHYVDNILSLIDQAHKDISKFVGSVQGPLALGASFTLGEYVIPKILGAFHKEFPQVKAVLQITNTDHIVNLVLKHEVDLGLVENFVQNEDLNIRPFLNDELIVAISSRHPLAHKQSISVQELLTLPLVLREKGSGTRKIAEERLAEEGFYLEPNNIVMELGSTEAVKEAVEAGFGITIISRWAISKEVRLGTLVPLQVKDIYLQRKFYMINHKGQFQTSVVEEFISFLQSHCTRNNFVCDFSLVNE